MADNEDNTGNRTEIAVLFQRFQDVAGMTPPATQAEEDEQYAAYSALQTRIVTSKAMTPQDVAMQIITDTDFGASEWSRGFFDSLWQLSGARDDVDQRAGGEA